MSPPPPSWQQIADDLRNRITDGEWQAGHLLPRMQDLAADLGVAVSTVRQAYGLLVREGRVESVRRLGTRVLPPIRRTIRHRVVLRDQLGYYFDATAQPLRSVRPTAVTREPAPPEIADLLGEGDAVVRARLLASPDPGGLRQLATSYLPASLATGPGEVLAGEDTGPGGILDRLEQELGLGPLAWRERVHAESAAGEVATDLQLATGAPVLVVTRITRSAAGRVVEVTVTRVDGTAQAVEHDLSRGATALWPVRPTEQ